MKAMMITAAGECTAREIDRPQIHPGQVLVRVHRVGLCGSDLSTFRGQNAMAPFPRIPGHEVGGEVLELGQGASGLAVGDRVVVLPYTQCGSCASCRNGRDNACEFNQTLGVQRDGALCGFIAVDADKCLVCNSLEYDQLALVEPLAVGMHVARRSKIDVGDDVVVFGCGVIGLGAIAAAAAMGGRVTAVDIDDRKESIALACGARRFVNTTRTGLRDLAASIDDGRGPAVVIEAAGVAENFRGAVELAAFCGRVSYVGYAKKEVSFDTALFVKKELTIRGSRNATSKDFAAVLSLLEQGRYPLNRLITGQYPLDRTGEALAAWSADPGSVVKTVIRVD